MKTSIGTVCVLLLAASMRSEMDAPQQSPAARVKSRSVFDTAVEWVGKQEPSESESAALLNALETFATAGVQGGFAALEGFLREHPQSAWNPALHMQLAEYYRRTGRFTLANSHWETAWATTRQETDPAARTIASRSLAGWTRLLGSLGRKEQLDALFAEASRLGLDTGPYASVLQGTREGLATMKMNPELSYRCGSFALAQVLKTLLTTNSNWRPVYDAPSPEGGFCLSDLVALADTNGFKVVAAQRPAGGELVVPSVVHWKLDHYAAIVEKQANRYRVMDPTSGGMLWMDATAINEESTGHFLVVGNLPSGWKALTTEQARLIRGKGFPNGMDDMDDDSGSDDDQDDGCPPGASNDGPVAGSGQPCSDCADDPEETGGQDTSLDSGEGGMAQWRVSEPHIQLWVEDVPLQYRDSSGRWVKLRVSYKHLAPPKGGMIGGFGDKWDCNWIGLLTYDGNSGYVTNHLTGGGYASFPANGNPEFKSARKTTCIVAGNEQIFQTTGTGATDAIMPSPYGRLNRYGYSRIVSGVVYLFLTNRMDRYGRGQFQEYENSIWSGHSDISRIHVLTDKDGKQSTFYYTNTSFPYLVTAVEDPYGRTARFIYDSAGQLTNITDTAGLVSSFKYNGSGYLTNLHTPYGDTGFKYYSGTNVLCALNRAIEISEPNGDKQLYAYRDKSSLAMTQLYLTPDLYLIQYRNSYHWNRQQYAALDNDSKANYLDMPAAEYVKASLKHWLHGNDYLGSLSVNRTLAASAGPAVNTNDTVYSEWLDADLNVRVENVFFEYTGQGDVWRIGTLKRISSAYWNGGNDAVNIERNAWGRPTKFTFHRNSESVCYTNEFDGDGRRLLKVWGPRGEQVRGYGYDGTTTNLLTSVTNAAGEVIRYTHDAGKRVTSITHASGLVTTNLYYPSGTYAGFLQTRKDLGFHTNSFNYENGNLQYRTNALGLVTTYTWDDLNRLTSVAFPDGTTRSNVYTFLDLSAAKDRLDQWTYFGFNSVRQMIAVTNVNGHVTLIDFCNCGSPAEITRLNGGSPVVTEFGHDLAGRTTTVTYPDSYGLSYFYDNDSYDSSGQLVRIEDSSGLAVHLGYADYDQLASVGLSPAGETAPDYYLLTRTFDEYGRLTNSVNRNRVVVTNAYDFLDRLTNRAVVDADCARHGFESFAYTSRGLTNSIDPLGNKTTFVFDAAGRLQYQTNALNGALIFDYDLADELIALTNELGNVTRWKYDEYGRVTNKVDALGAEIFRYQYDANDRLTNRWTPAKGGVDTAYRYDPLGNLTNVDYPGSVMDVTLKYDVLERLTNVVDAAGTTVFGYNGAGMLTSEDGPWSSDTVSYTYSNQRRTQLAVQWPSASDWTQSYGYDEYDRLTNVVSAAGRFGYHYSAPSGDMLRDLVKQLDLPGDSGTTITNDYDSIARLVDSALNTAAVASVNRHSYVLNDGNQRTKQTFKDANYVDYTYDALGQLKTAVGKESGGSPSRLHEQLGYAYDAAGNLSYRTNNALTQTFKVDTLNELTNVTRSGTFTVAGAASGATTSLSVNSQSVTPYADHTFAKSGFSLSDGNNTFTVAGQNSAGATDSQGVTAYLPASPTLTYDANGNLTGDSRRVFEYDYENQLTNVYVSGAWNERLTYDAFGRKRVLKQYSWNGSSWSLTNEVRYVYDGMLVLQERNNSNGPLITYTRGMDLSGSRQGAGGIGGLLARTDHGQASESPFLHAYYHCDGNGNVTCLVNTNGLVVAKYSYDPYGNLLGMAGPLAAANVYRFSSKEWHPLTGLYYYGFRYYEPQFQRWLNQDPIEEEGGVNLYLFAGNNSLLWTDAYGLDWTDWIPKAIFPAANFCAGAADDLSFGLTDVAREKIGWNDDGGVNKSSGAYHGGEYTSMGVQMVVPGAQAKVLAKKAGEKILIEGIEQGIEASAKNVAKKAAEERAKNIAKGIPGNQLGPSGKPKIHVVEHPSMKEAKDAARTDVGKGGTTVKHPSPKEGGPHFHGVEQDGTKCRIHHEFPD